MYTWRMKEDEGVVADLGGENVLESYFIRDENQRLGIFAPSWAKASVLIREMYSRHSKMWPCH